jgi:hypothetical protein
MRIWLSQTNRAGLPRYFQRSGQNAQCPPAGAEPAPPGQKAVQRALGLLKDPKEFEIIVRQRG